MFKIGDFSRLMRVSVRMLRYYDETGLLKPAKIDNFTNYRFYSTGQIPVLNRIIFLRDLGFNVSEIAAALKTWSNETISGLLDNKYKETENKINEEQSRLLKIELARKNILQEKLDINCNVSVKSIPGYRVLSLRRIIPDYFAEHLLWEEMAEAVKNSGVSFSGKAFTIYHDIDFRESDVDIEICVPAESPGENVNGLVFRRTEPVPVMACMMVYGKFENIAGAYIAFAGWLQDHNRYRMNGQSRQVVHKGPWNEKNPDNYLTEIQIPLEET